MGVYKIPQDDRKFSQPNDGEIFGNLWATRGIDLSSSKGKIRVSPRLKLNTSAMLVEGFVYAPADATTGGNRYYGIAGTHVVFGRALPTGTFSNDVTAGTPTLTVNTSDIKYWNGTIVVTAGTTVHAYSTSSSGSWSDLGAARSLGSLGAVSKLMEVGPQGNLYFQQLLYKIAYIPVSGNAVNSGSNGTITLDSKLTISWMRASSNRLWIGTVHNYNGKAKVIEWDMSTNSQAYNREYDISSSGTPSGVIVNDIPYIICADGSFKVFNGSGFKPIAKMPFTDSSALLWRGFLAGVYSNARNLHPNGMAVVDGKINFIISNLLSETTNYTTVLENFPSGVWEFDPDEPSKGIYHIGTPTLDAAGSLDWGQFFLSNTAGTCNAGAIIETKQKEARFLCSMSVFVDNATTAQQGIYYDDITSALTKRGSIITPQFHSAQIAEMWQNTWTRLSPLLNATDEIVVKFRTSKDSNFPQVNGITWTSTSTFTTTDSTFSNASVGDEIEVVMGKGGGTSAHISVIDSDTVGETTTYTVTLDEAITGATGTAKVMVNNWKKLGAFSTQNVSNFKYSLSGAATANWVQLKYELRGTGNSPEIDQFITVSEPQLNIT